MFDISQFELQISSLLNHRNQVLTCTHNNSKLGTSIWLKHIDANLTRCIKAFCLAEPDLYHREIPDPVWHRDLSTHQITGAERGLSAVRAQLYDNMPDLYALHQKHNEEDFLKQFRKQFNAYSFELEALITQIAQCYGHNLLVSAYHWGPMQLESSEPPKYAIEMERLQELPLPEVGDHLMSMHRLISMMSAVCQLHAMLIPVRCYPPELVRNIQLAHRNPFTRSFHYDLTPDQFLSRPNLEHGCDQLVLIDFNSSRMAYAENDNFFWRAMPGKHYFQHPELRNLKNYNPNSSFQSSPCYDLYALLAIGLFFMMRNNDNQKKPEQITGWNTPKNFYNFLQRPDLTAHLQAISNKQATGFAIEPLIRLIAAAMQGEIEQRIDSLCAINGLDWAGSGDWMLAPKAMNYLARHCMGRSFQVSWRLDVPPLQEGDQPVDLRALLDSSHCYGKEGSQESGRINVPQFNTGDIFYMQAEDSYPIVFRGKIHPAQAGEYQIFACWQGCVDFKNPLKIQINSRSVASSADLRLQSHHQNPHFPYSYTNQAISQEQPQYNIYPEQTYQPQYNIYPEQAYQPDLGQTSSIDVTKTLAYQGAAHNSNPQAHYVENDYNLHNSYTVESHGVGVYGGNYSQQPDNCANYDYSSVYNADLATPSHYNYNQNLHLSAHNGFVNNADAWEGKSFSPDLWPLDASYNQQNSDPNDIAQTTAVIPDISKTLRDIPPNHPVETLETWFERIVDCYDVAQLKELEAEIKNQCGIDLNFELEFQLLSRYCQLLLTNQSLCTSSKYLRRLADLRQSKAANIPTLKLGFLLNNLVIFCYESAYRENMMPDWDELFSFDPLIDLISWSRLSKPPSKTDISDVQRETYNRALETIRYAQTIKELLLKQSPHSRRKTQKTGSHFQW
jgi:hypothetical protein